jgi:predicted AlkP superfamily pyrophosphatase or phosphodiesterase
VTANQEQKFIFAYWDGIDALAHEYGINSPEVTKHFHELVKKLAALVKSLKNTETTLIITADHGLIDTEPSKIIQVKHHPELRDTLVLPLCGEPRTAFCYVRPSKTAQFENYIAQYFAGICDIFRSEELIHKGYFGLFEPDRRLFDRVGDYVLIMRENYIIKDFLLSEEETFHRGNHGGVSKEEMFVPLVILRV